MQLTIRPLQKDDYHKTLRSWWKDWRWVPPSLDFLPEEGIGGYIVYEGETPICAGFMYKTNSAVAWCDWIISNLKYKDREKRRQAINLLIDTITLDAECQGFKFVYALIKNKPLVEAYKALGYIEGSSYSTEMIKQL